VLGVGSQTMTELAGLTVAENLFLAAPAELRPAYGRMEEWATQKLSDYQLAIRAAARTETLSLAQRQMLEVVQALLSHPKVLLLDEPTTALGRTEVDRLHELIRTLAADGVGVVYVSHRLPEVLEVATRITVLRDGVAQGTFEATALTEADVVTLMVGRPMDTVFPESQLDKGEIVLTVNQLSGRRF